MSQEKIWSYFQNEGAEYFAASQPRYAFLLNAIKARVEACSAVLNIGVGNGKLESMLAESRYLVSALDPDAQAIAKLIATGIDARCGSAEELPFENDSFEAIIASEVLEHLDSESCHQAASEIRRTLKPGGYFIGTVPYQEQLADNVTVCPHCGERFHRWGHQQSFDRKRLTDLFGDGFELVHLSRRAFVAWNLPPFRMLKSCFRWILGRCGEQVASPHFYFEFRKKI